MQLRFALLVLALSACRSESSQPSQSAREPASKLPSAVASSLFDGQSLANWDGDSRFWRVENGCIVGESTETNPCAATTYLLWRGGEVANFELSFEYRIVGGNSGVQFRGDDRGGWQVAGFQADIEDGPNWTGCLYEQDGAGVVATRGENVTLDGAGARKERFADANELLASVRKQDWNRYVIRARGEQVELEVNGRVTAKVTDLRATRRLGGKLALQLHAGPPMRVEYRGLQLEKLPDSVPAPVVANESGSDGKSQWSPRFDGARPQWLWASAESPEGDTVAMRREFELAGEPTRALLRCSADNHVRVFLGGELVLAHDDWSQAVEVDVTKQVQSGANSLVALCRNDGGPAGAWFELVVERKGAKPLRLQSDGSWAVQRLAANEEWKTWKPAQHAWRLSPPHVVGSFGVSPWGSLAWEPQSQEEDEQRALAAEELTLLPGFRAQLLYSVPRAKQGSWVSLTEDPAGRLYASDQYGALFRVTVGASESDTRVETVDVNVGSAHGLCWAHDSLYAVVSEGGGRDNGLYRIRDTDGDDRLDHAQLLRKFGSGGEHGPHAVVQGPDGALWIVGGNHTDLPEPIDTYARPRNWAEDLLEPRIEDPNGHAVGIRAPAGWVVRTDADGKRWELWACGFRNAYDIAFDREGELFTFDSDMEWDMGAPWYRPTRVFHVVRGADFGWRGGPGKMPPCYPDTLPSVVDIGPSSPTGVTFGYGAKFPARYERALYALDWAYGTIYAVHLEAQGSTYGATFEKFATGKPFPVTDAVIGRDGAMYVTTGGRRTQSGLYRITSDLTTRQGAAEVLATVEAERAAQPARELRRSIEGLLGGTDGVSADLLDQLDSTDRFTAHAARIALEQRPLPAWAYHEPATESGRIQSCVALAHAGNDNVRDVLLGRLARLDFDGADEQGKIAIVRANQLADLRLDLEDDQRSAIAARFESRYPSGSAALDRELLQLLVGLDSPRALAPALDLLESDAPQEERIWAAYCLRVASSGWTPELRRRQFRGLASLRAVAKGGHSLVKYVDEIRRQSAAGMDEATKTELADLLEAPQPAVASNAVAKASFVRSWNREDLAGFVRDALVGRDFERGKATFAKARCVECHRMAGEGGGTGPDLTGAGSRFSRSDWLDSLLEPSKVISDQYQDTEILTTEGDLLVGRIERDDPDGVTIRRLPPQEDAIDLAPSEIERRRPYPMSRMPAGLLDVLDEDEIRDLAAYVLSGANPESAEFRKP